MRRPVNSPYQVTTEFGEVDSYALYGVHSGYDYAVATGTAIYATTNGTIISTIEHPTRGRMVTLFDGKYYHRFMHNTRFNVTPGQKVNEGDVIAYSGGGKNDPGRGTSTGPHCHWDMNTRGVDTNSFADFVDPDDWLKGRIPAAAAPAPAFPDLASLQPYERAVRPSESVFYRVQPNTGAALLKTDGDPDGLFEAGEVIPFKGWVYGESVGGNNVWFVGRRTGGYSWSGAYTDPGTQNLDDLNPKPAPPADPTPIPTPPAPEPGTVIQPTPPIPTLVVDISAYNAVTDYVALKAAVRGVIAKAGHTGKSYGGIQPNNSDPQFDDHYDNLGDKLVGAYWYAYCDLDPEDEAEAFLATVGQVPATFSFWLDIEEDSGKSKTEVNAWVRAFCDVIEDDTGRRCGLYMSRNWFDNYIDDETKGRRPIWLAHFDTPQFSNPVKNQVAHQYTSKGTIAGISGAVDLNVVREEFFVPDPDDPKPADPTPQPVSIENRVAGVESRVDTVENYLRSFKG